MTYLIVGGSSGVGRSLAAAFAAAGHDLIIVSSDARDAAATAADLSIRFGRRVTPVACDVSDTAGYVAALERAVDASGDLDGAMFPVGAVLADDDVDGGTRGIEWTLRVNYIAVTAAVASLLPRLRRRPAACIIGFGSISAARGRRINVTYAASKRALESYFESLRHACAATSIVVQFYVLGFVDTALAYGRRTPIVPAAAEALSAAVLRNRGRDIGVVYYPRIWWWITGVLRLLPWWIVRRLSF